MEKVEFFPAHNCVCTYIERHMFTIQFDLFFFSHIIPMPNSPIAWYCHSNSKRCDIINSWAQNKYELQFDAIYVLASAYKPKQETFPLEFCLKLYRSTMEFAIHAKFITKQPIHNGNQHFEQEKCLKNRKVNKVNIFFYDFCFEWKWKQTFKQNTNDWNERW